MTKVQRQARNPQVTKSAYEFKNKSSVTSSTYRINNYNHSRHKLQTNISHFDKYQYVPSIFLNVISNHYMLEIMPDTKSNCPVSTYCLKTTTTKTKCDRLCEKGSYS